MTFRRLAKLQKGGSHMTGIGRNMHGQMIRSRVAGHFELGERVGKQASSLPAVPLMEPVTDFREERIAQDPEARSSGQSVEIDTNRVLAMEQDQPNDPLQEQSKESSNVQSNAQMLHAPPPAKAMPMQ
eukprot:6491053-Amphidinium_carterae.2